MTKLGSTKPVPKAKSIVCPSPVAAIAVIVAANHPAAGQNLCPKSPPPANPIQHSGRKNVRKLAPLPRCIPTKFAFPHARLSFRFWRAALLAWLAGKSPDQEQECPRPALRSSAHIISILHHPDSGWRRCGLSPSQNQTAPVPEIPQQALRASVFGAR